MSKTQQLIRQLLSVPTTFKEYVYSFPLRSREKFQNNDHLDLHDIQQFQEGFKPTQNLLEQLQTAYSQNPNSKKSLFLGKFIFNHIWIQFAISFIFGLILTILSAYTPFALKNMVDYFQGTISTTFLSVFSLYIGIQVCQILLSGFKDYKNHFLHLNMHNMVKFMIYNKMLRISCGTKQFMETGTIVNYYHSNTGQIGGFIHWGLHGFFTPVKLCIAGWYLMSENGYLGVLGFIIIIGSFLFKIKYEDYTKELRKQESGISDKFSKLINQYVSGIRILKYYGWEKCIAKKITDKKQEKYRIEEKIEKIQTFIHHTTPLLFNFYALMMFVFTWFFYGTIPSVGTYIVNRMVLGRLEGAINDCSNVYRSYSEFDISMTKIMNFLLSEERENYVDENVQKGQINITGEFSWDSNRAKQEEIERKTFVKEDCKEIEEKIIKPQLSIPCNLSIKPGQLIGVIGKVGSGKSTLLSSILGQTTKFSGELKRRGSISFCPETPWLLNSTIKENIVFHNEFDEEKYLEALEICQLTDDLKVLEKGDETQVGEKGIKLSGGQKQRITLARCLYNNAEINIIDDCLSALDAYVGQKIFNNVILSKMKDQNKTVVLALSALQYLKYCDQIIFLEEGQIKTVGNVQQVQAAHPEYFSTFKDFASNNKQASEDLETISCNSDVPKKQKKQTSEKKNQQAEKVEANNKEQAEKKPKILKSLLFFFSLNNWGKTILVVFLVFLINVFNLAKSFWIGYGEDSHIGFTNFFMVLACIFITHTAVEMLQWITHKKNINEKAGALGKLYIQSLFRAKITWFDSKPVGQIIERGVGYQNQLEGWGPHLFNWMIHLTIGFTIRLAFICFQIPQAILLIGVAGVILAYWNSKFRKFRIKIAEINEKHGEKLSSKLQETVEGLFVIRSFNKTKVMVSSYDKLHLGLIHLHGNWGVIERIRNQGVRFVNILFTCSICYILSLMKDQSATQNFVISIIFFQITHITGQLNSFFDLYNQLYKVMKNMNKITSWVDNMELQKQYEFPEPVSENWLHSGVCDVKNISLKYKESLPYILNDVSFSMKKGQKIGVVGRTGCGKSTLTLGLIRLLEIHDNQNGSKGQIRVDDTNISEIGLHHVRHNIAMIPQDPLLYSGTIKSNLDPLNKVSDQQMADCLIQLDIWDSIKKTVENHNEDISKILDAKVDEGGQNFSIGQKQMLCLARALIRRPKLLIMDEATARIDLKTDSMLQNLIEQKFRETTVITIAHRLNTIIKYDKILVLEEGKVAEFASPTELLKDENSYLCKSVKKVGEQYHQAMLQLALNK